MTVASIMLIEPRETIICGEVYADSAYANKKNDEKLGQQNNKVLQ
jgi:IS5 family transposase